MEVVCAQVKAYPVSNEHCRWPYDPNHLNHSFFIFFHHLFYLCNEWKKRLHILCIRWR